MRGFFASSNEIWHPFILCKVPNKFGSDTESTVPKQASLSFARAAKPLDEDAFYEDVLRFVVDSNAAFSTVEHDTFWSMFDSLAHIAGFDDGAALSIGRTTFMRKLKQYYDAVRNSHSQHTSF